MEYTTKKPLRVITLCSGYDSQCLALERLKAVYTEFDYKLVAWSEFDPESKSPLEKQPAVIAHNALFPQWSDRNLGDMTKIDWDEVEDFDLLFYSTPCQSISSAGLRHGFTEGSGTRSSIIWNVRDAVKTKRPKYLCFENVKAIINKKFVGTFNIWLNELQNLGYRNYLKVLNSKDYGVPQNRERVFVVSVRDGEPISSFNFPSTVPLNKTLEQIVESNVSDKYNLSEEIVEKFKDNVTATKTKIGDGKYILNAINGVACTLTCSHHYAGNIIHPRQGFREMGVLDNGKYRRLTERENFRLMGLDDDSIEKIANSGLTITTQYKLAGNSIVVDVLYHLFRKMFVEKDMDITKEGQQLLLF